MFMWPFFCSILENLRELAEGCLGRPMLYELIEYAKESLTDNNTPSCACAICLCHFQVECPMCRLPITYDLAELKTVASSAENDEELIYEPSAEIRELQKKMSSLLEKQKRKGGVIDVEQERNKFLIDITSVRQEETSPESEPPTGPETDTVTKNPIVENMANTVPKRVDAEKEASQAENVMRKDKPDRIEKKEFSKYSRTSRGPRRPVDKTRHRSSGEKFKHYEQRRTDKKRPTTCDRPESVEKEDKEKESAKEPDKQGSDCALWAETKPDGNRTELESEKKYPVVDTTGKDLSKDPGKGSGKDPGKGPGKDQGKGSGKDPEKDPGKDPGKGPGKDPEKGPGKDAEKDTGKGPRKDEGGVTGRSNNIKSSQNSYGERPRSARRGRGRSGKGKPSAGSANESRDGVRNVNNSFTLSGEVVKRPEMTGPLESSKPSCEENGRPQAQNSSHEINPSGEEGRVSKKGKVGKPPPGFENFQADKVGREQSTNGHRPPPGFKQHSTKPRPPPGLGNLAEGPGQNTSQSIAS
ncbi:serine/arginine repetitive matrix protein 1-like isoform X3 [Orbicella faveolata]|uniref:serine/arginine repetitive matrix protein 1-like isoform X3 n=1 Tax=Orbicella faveolata TaxID=48498 RepID=UPI0009E2F688|nr:serine/arginine repetitive matrix protein 1-like isoform X3 [Orbicella faveolata]